MSGPADQRVATIASAQRGRVSRRQLLAAGLSAKMIEGRLASGRLHSKHRGVYAVGHAAAVELGDETAALLAAGDGAVLSHASAGSLWEILRHPRDPRIHVTVAECRFPRRAGVCVHRSTTLLPHDLRIRRWLPVTSPARTLLDLAGVVDARDLELALDEALRHKLLTPAQVADMVARAPHRAGAPALAALLGRAGCETVTRSEAEEMLLALIRRAGLPEPQLNVRCQGYLVDALWPALRVVVEVDGHLYHGSRRAFEDDRAKGAALSAAGYGVVRITVRQMTGEPHAVIARLAQALAWAQAQIELRR
ncbi:MAG: DUF559 domain-containing protein [Actinomycetota bacterium]|nr:DUF559 domain-containing protein [Actinomycetota bacterium]